MFHQSRPNSQVAAPVLKTAVLIAVAAAVVPAAAGALDTASRAGSDGIVKVQSAYSFNETVTLLKQDVADKGIMFFDAIDQSQLGANAGFKLRPSTLLIFGSPPLGIQFLTANPDAGLDWPVRLLVTEDENGNVWADYTDFTWIARRHHIKDRGAAFKMATSVIDSITYKVARN